MDNAPDDACSLVSFNEEENAKHSQQPAMWPGVLYTFHRNV